MSTFQIWVIEENEETGEGKQPGSMAMRAKVVDGKLVPILDGLIADEACEPLAKVVRRKLAPKSGNQLFVS